MMLAKELALNWQLMASGSMKSVCEKVSRLLAISTALLIIANAIAQVIKLACLVCLVRTDPCQLIGANDN